MRGREVAGAGNWRSLSDVVNVAVVAQPSVWCLAAAAFRIRVWGTDTPKRPKHTHTTLAQAHEACGSIPGSSARAHVETDPAQDWGGGGSGWGRLCCSSSLQTSRELQKLSGCPRFGGSLGIFSLPLSAVCCVFPPTFSWVREQPRASYLCARGAFLPTEASKVSLFCFVEGERFEQEPHESSS